MTGRAALLLLVPGLALAGALAVTACDDLDRFETAPGEAYCGSVGALFAQDGFLPDDAPPRLVLRLELDPDALTEEASSFGVLSSNDGSAGDAVGVCDPEPLFDDAPLRAIAPMAHDPLALLKFGDGRERNVMAYVDSTCLGSLVAVVSFMSDGRVELRLLKPRPSTADDAPAVERPGFALFQLDKRSDRCF